MAADFLSSLFHLERLDAIQPDAVLVSFANIEQWIAWEQRNLWIADPVHIASFATHARQYGACSTWLGWISPAAIAIVGTPPTIDIFAAHLPQSQRAVLDLVAVCIATSDRNLAKIYAAEGLSPFALALRGRYPLFVGSEYTADTDHDLFPIENQDLQQLTYPSSAFDLAITREVLEHVPDLPAALRELARILRPGGVMLSTFPFLWGTRHSLQRARIVNGSIEYIVDPPEYHSDGLRQDGALVFRTPGWDILEMARDAGFSAAEFLLYSSKSGVIVGPEQAGMWIMAAIR